ncbi:hypothetical protein L4D20_11810 [Vibrio kyushuensis]|uniref:hypothetical protein n=1 Tax=Vibrio kyushuensis TaxID=2910249 RepID=UPI003D13EDF2
MQVKAAKMIAALSLIALATGVCMSAYTHAAYLDEETGEVVIVADTENEDMLGAIYYPDEIDSEGEDTLQEKQVNYGDPMASFKGVGVQGTNDAWSVSGIYGGGKHIAVVELGSNSNKGLTHRIRYFNTDDDSGFGWSVDVMGDNSKNSNTNGVLAGVMQRFIVSDNIQLFPMFGVGKLYNQTQNSGLKTKADTWVAQPALYAMYAFDSGHWLYANPKANYIGDSKKWITELELGGGYMTSSNTSVGFKYDISHFQNKTDTKGWVNMFYYF